MTGRLGTGATNGPETSVAWEEWRPLPPTTVWSVPLGELLTIAVLTPAQAALVMADLLHAADAAAREGVRAVVCADGTLNVTEPDQGATGDPLADLVDAVVHNARRLPSHPQPQQLALLRHVEEQASGPAEPAQRANALREALGEVLGAGAVPRIRREIAALVGAFRGIAIPRPASGERVNGHDAGAAPALRPATPRERGHRPPGHAPHEHLPHGRGPHGHGPHRTPRHVGRQRAHTRRMLLLLLVAALVLAGGGYLVLRGPGTSGLLDSLGGGSAPSGGQRTTPSTPSTPSGQHTGHTAVRRGVTFPALAAQSAGPVRRVVLHRPHGCQPGGACSVKVTVHLVAAGAGQVVAWRVGVARPCTRHVTWSPVTTMTARPGWTRVFATSSVHLPKRHSVALVALTSAPAHAQSQLVPVAGAARRC